MRITAIHIDGFGKLHDFDMELSGGINVVFGYNEAGKTTLHLFIRSMLYGASEKSKGNVPSIYERMRPWKTPGVYGGRIEAEHEGRLYMISRDFDKAPDDITVMDISDGEPVPVEDTDAFMYEILGGLSETAYVNTVSAGQLNAATEKSMAAELRRYASNVSSTANPDMNADAAILELKRRRITLKTQYDDNAAKEYAAVQSEIKQIEEELASPENENKIVMYSEAAGRVRKESEDLQDLISYNDEKIEEKKSALKEYGFTSQEEIERVFNDIHDKYDEFRNMDARARNKMPVVTAVIFALAAIVCIVGVVVSGGSTLSMSVCIAGAIVCTVMAVLSIVFGNSIKKKRNTMGDSLASELSVYIIDARPVDEDMERFDKYILEARDLYSTIVEAKRYGMNIGNRMRELIEEHSTCLDNLEAQRDIRHKVEKSLTRLAELKRYASTLRKKIRDNNVIRENIEAIELAEETLTELTERVRNAAGTYINKEASRMAAGFTGGRYSSINAGSEYDIILNSKDGMRSVSDISAGTTDQIYLAIRLASVRFITGDTDPVPITLDDSFNLFDDSRLSAAAQFLAENFNGQIIIFTCQGREPEVFEEACRRAGTEYGFIDMNRIA